MVDFDRLSKKVKTLRRKPSPIKEIMNYGDPEYIRKFGINPDDLISFAGGWSNHKAPEELRKAYENIVSNPEEFHYSGSYSTSCLCDQCQFWMQFVNLKNICMIWKLMKNKFLLD